MAKAAKTTRPQAKKPKFERVTLEELQGNMCRWPIGDPKEEDFRFCGAERAAGSSYCCNHVKMAYRSRNSESGSNSAGSGKSKAA